MAQQDSTIAINFIEGKPSKDSLIKRVRAHNGGWSAGGHNTPMFASEGTRRFWHDEAYLYSYNMKLALRTTYEGKVFVLINGDGAPSMMTRKHQGELRTALTITTHPRGGHGWRGAMDAEGNYTVPVQTPRASSAFVPFSALDRARIREQNVEVVHVTPDREETRLRKDRSTGEMVETTVHFLGETLFRDKRDGRLYVCGLDRNDNPNKRMFYLCRLPEPAPTTSRREPRAANRLPGPTKLLAPPKAVAKPRYAGPPRTVDEALKSLRPRGLSETALRQGEWFFDPAPDFVKPKGVVELKQVPITSADPKVQSPATSLRMDNWDERRRRHVALRMVITDKGVYVKGRVKDDEHDPTPLGDGKTWYRVVKNLADEGWRYVNQGVKVD